jgi:hypothetical protein
MSETRNPGKRRKMLDSIHNEWKKNVEKNMCDCLHTHKGDLNIVPSPKKKNGLLIYTCRACTKELHLNVIDEADQDQALNIVDRMCDIIKMSLDQEKPKDQKIAEKISETQFRVRNQLKSYYAAALQKNGSGGRNKKNNNRRDQDSTWEKATISGRR